jgi:hypothetical protein
MLTGDVLNCVGKTVKNFDALIINSLLIHGQRYLRQVYISFLYGLGMPSAVG